MSPSCYLARDVDDSYVTAGGSLTGEQARLRPQQEQEPGGRLPSSSSEHGEAAQPVGTLNVVGSPNGGSPLQATPVPRQVLPHPTSPNKQPRPQLQLQDPGHCSGSVQHSPWSATPRPLHQPVLQVSPDPVQSCLGPVLSDKHMSKLTCSWFCFHLCVSSSSASCCCCWAPSVSMSPDMQAGGGCHHKLLRRAAG